MSEFSIEKNAPFKRFERLQGAVLEFMEIHVSENGSPKIWICEGRGGEPGINRVVEYTDRRLKEATALVEKFRKSGYIYAGEVKKIIDNRYTEALRNHDPADLFSCLKDGYSPHAFLTEKGSRSSAMMVALQAGAVESVRALVEAGCNVDWLQKWADNQAIWNRPLLSEVLKQDLSESTKFKVAEVLLAKGANPNAIDRLGYAPIHIVSSAKIAGLLLDSGALIELRSVSGKNTPLHAQCSKSNGEVVDFLIRNGADVNSKNGDGDTPLILAAHAGGSEVVQLLLAGGADPAVRNKEKSNALMKLFSRRHSDGKEKANIVKCVKVLLGAGVSASSQGARGRTALMAALHNSDTQAAKVLVAAGADINAKDSDSRTALMQGAINGDSALVKRCLSLGADVDVQGKLGETALMLSLGKPQNGKYTSLIALIDAGANLQKIDCNHPSVLHAASIDEVVLLLSAGVIPDATGGAALMARAVKEDSLPLALALIGKATAQVGEQQATIEFPGGGKPNSQFLRKLLSAEPAAWKVLISIDPEIQEILARCARDDGAQPDHLEDDDLPAVLLPGYWTSSRSAPAELPGFWVAGGHPAPRRKSNGKPLPHHAIDTIARMMLVSTHDKPAPEISQVTAACDASSLAAFAWSAFVEWNAKGKKSSDGFFHALAFWGDADAARRLTPLIRDWPGGQQSPRAVLGLDILCTMGTDAALRAIQTIAAKTRYAALRERAKALMDRIAVSRKLTSDQFEDRLVPTLDLSERGAIAVSFGARHFEISTDEQLKPMLKDAAGVVLKALPNPAGADDALLAAQAAAAWSEFKVSLKPVASLQLVRLEKAMLGTRRWLGDEFKRHVAGHPLLQKPARGLVWGIYENENLKNTFALDGNGGFVGPQGDSVALDDGSQVGLPHPLFFRPDIEAWLKNFAARSQRQPFAQLVRKTFLASEDVDGTHFGLNGLVVPSNSLKGLRTYGWGADDTFAGTFSCLNRRFEKNWASLDVSPGLSKAGYDVLSKQQTLHLHCGKLSPLEYSEMMRELLTLKP